VLQLQSIDHETEIAYVGKLISAVFDTCQNLEKLQIQLACLVPQRLGLVPRVYPPVQSKNQYLISSLEFIKLN